jgi:two-component system, cell cycle sensor histidine kinase and response regulator CckA
VTSGVSVSEEILVVDDTPASLKLLGGILSKAGYGVRLAPEGELALRSARQRPPALVLLDIRMPGLNGYEVCRALKADEKTRAVPVIFLSVSDDEQEKSLAFQLGGVDYVSKPVRAAEVLARVSTHLTLRRARLELEAQNTALTAAGELLEERVRERSAELEQANAKLQEQMRSQLELHERLRQSEARLSQVLRAATAYSIIAMGPSGVIEVMNEGAALMLGYSAEEVIDKATPMLFHEPQELARRASEQGVEPGFEVLVQKARRGEIDTREWTYVRRDGSQLTVSLTVTAMRSQDGQFTGFICVARDITGEKQLEQQLLQSQKMECVGQLSGGIAHDFNNLLTPIKGYVHIVKTSLPEDHPLRRDVLLIEQAADSAKELTRQLLAFSRKQIIDLKPVDLREIVRRSANILRRTIRENVRIELKLSPSLGVARADAGQIELVLVNLSINAQDAMQNGGLLIIETADAFLDEAYASHHPGVAPGPYVALAVSDTGVGMDEATMTRIFEPFFTTKEVGKGTGLGLSTAYGIIKQHGGSISVYSEKGHGSVFKVFLPRSNEAKASEPAAPSDVVLPGTETLLVTEDNHMVRALLDRLLPGLGYRILMASSAEECMALMKSHAGVIHLLLTDVVMPGLNGRELYERLRELRPALKVLFMSGYTTDVIGRHGMLDESVHFLHKPFTLAELSIKLRQALDS